MDDFEKICIILGFLIIIMYFIFYFDFQKILTTCLNFNRNNIEHFDSYLFQPQKLFQHQGKIYLLDTQRVLEIDRNPMIFNSYPDYQKYIVSLEEEFKKNLQIKIGNTKKNLDEISEKEIPSLDFKMMKKREKEKENMNPYYQNYECERQSAHCKLDADRDPFFSSIYDPVKLKEFQDRNCREQLLSKDQCDIIKMMVTNEKNLNRLCHDPKMRQPDYRDKYKVICDKHKIVQNHSKLLERACSKDSTYEENCKLDDFFREELLSSLAK
jgi:hypothetical protein